MGTTTIKRKALRNRIKAKQRKANIKRLTSTPTLKNIDTEAIVSTFEKPESKKPAKKVEAVENTDNTTITKEAVKSEKAVKEKVADVKEEVKADKPKADKPVAKSTDKKPGTDPKLKKPAPKKKA